MPLKMLTKGAKEGACNICGSHGPLTEDHTPPKGCVRPTAVEIQHVTHRLDVGRAIKSKANDGVKYRTLCARCNNLLLGSRYDPALIDFTSKVSKLLTSSILLPATSMIRAKPALIIRAVWGHLAAVGVDRYQKGARTEEWRDFFLDESRPVPQGANFYYWIYPYRRQVLIRDAVVGDLQDHSRTAFWLMKFYPIAFAFWQPASGNATLPLRDLASYCPVDPQTEVDVPIDLFSIPHELALEAPTTTQALLFGRDSVVATNRPPRGKVLKGFGSGPTG